MNDEEEVISYGAGGVPYVGIKTTVTPAPISEKEEEVKTEEEPAVTISVTEKETPGDIPRGKKGRKQNEKF